MIRLCIRSPLVAAPCTSCVSDLVFLLDGKEIYRSAGQGDQFPEPMFAILNFAKINDSPMNHDWVMEVDWVRHEYRREQ